MYYTRRILKTHRFYIGLVHCALLLWFPGLRRSPFFTVPISFMFLIPCQAEEING